MYMHLRLLATSFGLLVLLLCYHFNLLLCGYRGQHRVWVMFGFGRTANPRPFTQSALLAGSGPSSPDPLPSPTNLPTTATGASTTAGGSGRPSSLGGRHILVDDDVGSDRAALWDDMSMEEFQDFVGQAVNSNNINNIGGLTAAGIIHRSSLDSKDPLRSGGSEWSGIPPSSSSSSARRTPSPPPSSSSSSSQAAGLERRPSPSIMSAPSSSSTLPSLPTLRPRPPSSEDDLSGSAFVSSSTSSSSSSSIGKRKFNIAIISDFFFPRLGGVELHQYQLAQCLIRRGHKVIVITGTYSSNKCHTERQGIRWMTNGLKVYYCPQMYIKDQASLPTFFSFFPLLRNILLREQIDIVHGHQVIIPYAQATSPTSVVY
jgi:hypothetical protein